MLSSVLLLQTTLDSFEALDAHVEQRYKDLGWPGLTPIQSKSYRLLTRGRNALLVAPTGSGKTEAAVIPIFTRLAHDVARPSSSPSSSQTRKIRMMYITPLRALNRDILRRLVSYAEAEGLRAEIRHGDTPASARQKMLASPPDILVTTPETLGIILTSRKFRQHLTGLECVVVDELHELLGSERGSHLTLSLERLQRLTTKEMTRVGLSATVGDLDEAGRFLVGTSRKCAIVTDTASRGYDVDVRFIDGSFSRLALTILDYIKEKNGEDKSTLVFTNTRDEAEFLGAILKAKSPQIPVEVHHGSLSKETRETTESMLRRGEAGIVVCTSSLELGLDIGAVNMVIQVGSPRQAVKLIQRIGRSRHKLRHRAMGGLVANRPDDELEGLALLERVEESSLEKTLIHFKPLDVLAHHIAGLALEESSFSKEKAVSLFKAAYPFSSLSEEDFDSTASLLERLAIIRYDGEIFKRRGPKTYDYYYSNTSTIPDIQQFDVVDATSKKIIGRLDQVFVGEYGEPGKPFVLKGNSWKIISIDDDKKTLYVEPLFGDISTIPYWVGELLPVELESAQIVGRLRREIASDSYKPEAHRNQNVSQKQVSRLKESARILNGIPDNRGIVIERKKGSSTIVVHSCLGTRINQTLATVLSTLLAAKIGYLVETKSDSYRILLTSSGFLTGEHVESALKEDVKIEEILSASIIGTHPLNWKTWYVSKKFGVVDKSAQYDRRAARLIQDRYKDTVLYREILRELYQEKYDVDRTKLIMDDLRNGRLQLRTVEIEEFSGLAKPILEFVSGFAALPLTMEKAILDLVKQRLDNSKHKLLCLSCARYESVKKTSEIQDPIFCPLCHSRLVTETYSTDIDLPKIIQKKKEGRKLNEDEDKKYRRAWKTSSLIQNFGRRAILILSGFGVGVDTAARIIRRTGDEEQTLKNIYVAEKNYLATRGFWQDQD
jgi:ATP-dependent Lhr-like helicase